MRLLWLCVMLVTYRCVSGQEEVVVNGGFESTDNWECYRFECTLSNDKHSGRHSLESRNRPHTYSGPAQVINVKPGHTYSVSGWIKLLNDAPDGSHSKVSLFMDFRFTDNTHSYVAAASHPPITTHDGWAHLVGEFSVPTNKPIDRARLYWQGPETSVNFLVDDTSVIEHVVPSLTGSQWRQDTDDLINRIRKNDINIRVSAASGVNLNDVEIQVLQTKKSFPFGSAANARAYSDQANGGYRDFLHQHFNWAVTENCLKWPSIERHRGENNIHDCLSMIQSLRSHGLKVRGHNLVWSVERHVQDWVKALSGDQLRNTVQTHIEHVMDQTHGLLEHWDVNNENLHGTWYQDRLGDPDYNLELFRIAHRHDPNVKLFLNDYAVVASGSYTEAYQKQAQTFKDANVGLYGIGVQCHFHAEPNPLLIKERLDTLATVGVPIWATELDVRSMDEDQRADYYETALRALYGHPAVEGILMWGFWDGRHWLGEQAALVKGSNYQLTAAGRRVLDLLENQWMTDETRSLAQAGDHFTVRGFHGDYEVRVLYQGHELTNLRKTFTLRKGSDENVHINVHV